MALQAQVLEYHFDIVTYTYTEYNTLIDVYGYSEDPEYIEDLGLYKIIKTGIMK